MAVRRGTYTETKVLQSSAQATGNGETFPLSLEGAQGTTDYDSINGAWEAVAVQVEGISGDTITFEVTIDNSTWYAIGLVAIADWTTIATTATADGIYVLQNPKGLSKFRARISTYDSGTIIVTAQGAA